MTSGQWIILLVVLFLVSEPIAIAWVIVRFGWLPLEKRFPARDPGPDAVSRNFQSFTVRFLSLGWSLHVTVDEDHLHLAPAAWLRVFGADRLSIPWNSIAFKKRTLGRRITVKVDKWALTGPAWCLELSDPGDPDVK